MAQVPSIVRDAKASPRRDRFPGRDGPSRRARHAVPLHFDQRRPRSCRGLPGSRSPGLRVAALRTPPQLTLFLLLLLSAITAFAQFETKLTASDPGREDFFGEAVAISGDDVIVGVRTSDDGNRVNTGAAYVFKRIDGQWQEVQKLVASDRSAGDFFGESVAIDGDRILVGALGVGGRCPAGANFNTCNFGAVYAFERIDGQWQQVQKLEPIDLGGPADQVFLSLFVTGIRFASGVANMSATIDGEDVPVFSFVGELEQFLGLGQVNIGPIDRSFIGRGPVEVIFTAHGKPSNPVMVSFK